MPWSWVRVPWGTSRKMRDCIGDERTAARADSCVRTIVEDDGGRVERTWFETNGKFLHAHVYWESVDQKNRIVLDLEAVEVVDVMSVEEFEEFAGPYSV